MGTPKKTTSLRLSETTITELNNLANRFKVSQADVVAVLVHCFYTSDELDAEKIEEWFDIVKLS